MMKTSKALIEFVTQDVLAFLVEDKGLSIKEAMAMFYHSTVFDKLSDTGTGLYRESAGYVYALLQDELQNGRVAVFGGDA
jgi:hypothetical protein